MKKKSFKKWLESIDYQEIYKSGDVVEFVEDIIDYDTGRVMVKKGEKAKVSGMNNSEYVTVKLKNGKIFYAYVLNIRKIWKESDLVKIGDRVEATKDIFDQTGYKILINRGDKGVVKELKSKEWPKILWDNIENYIIGVHISEIEKESKLN